jgi:hypothetical protein
VRFVFRIQTKNEEVTAQKFRLELWKIKDPELKSNPALRNGGDIKNPGETK